MEAARKQDSIRNNADIDVSLHEMHGSVSSASSDTWVFNIEAVSTLLIAAWYVYGVLISLGILPEGGFYSWGSSWVIPFLLGIFYLGAGYLFQQHQNVNDFRSWLTYMKRETIVLLTPFFSFTILVLLTGSLVSTQPTLVDSGLVGKPIVFDFDSLVRAIFIDPVDPVGYFIVLLGFFVIARTPRTKQGMYTLLSLAIIARVIAVVLSQCGVAESVPYYPMHWLDNWIWFILGIAISFFKLPNRLSKVSVASFLFAAFVLLGICLFFFDSRNEALLTILVLLGLLGFYSISAAKFLKGKQNAFFGFVTKYTMAIWLMHEMISQIAFCALFACGLGESGAIGDMWIPLFAISCLVCCYVLPIFAMKALSRIWKLGFIVYPSRYLPKDF